MQPTLVCIDDEAHNNEAIERLLRKKYQVFTATTPTEGLALIEKHKPSVIISDQRMPQMTGVELLKQSVSISPNSVRILLTGYTDLESVIAAINEGEIYRYLTKPWDPSDLSLTVEKAVETYNLKSEVKRQNLELQSLDRLKSDFMILVTHELRTPLAGIASFVELLKEEVTHPDHKKYLKHIEKNTDRLKKLIEDILIITKLKTGDGQKKTEDVDVKTSFEEVWNSKKLSQNLKVQGDLGKLHAPPEQVREIFSRLVENVHQHGAPKSDVTLKSDGNSLRLSNSTEKPITVNADKLLNSFTKSENIMNHTQGTGLGLNVVKALTEAMNGQMDIDIKDKNFSVILTFPEYS